MDDDYELPEEWSEETRNLFSRLYRHASINQHMFSHPDADELPPSHWEVVCWNMAWMAAICAHDGNSPAQLIHTNESGEVLAMEVTKEMMQ